MIVRPVPALWVDVYRFCGQAGEEQYRGFTRAKPLMARSLCH